MKLKDRVSCLVNSNLLKVGRSADMLWLLFEKDTIIYSLHVQCPFRFIRQGKIIIASHDMYCPSKKFNGEYETFNWDVEGANLFDENVKRYLDNYDSKCIQISISEFNDLKVVFDNSIELYLYSVSSTYEEQWRLFEKGNKNKEHVVVTSSGYSLE